MQLIAAQRHTIECNHALYKCAFTYLSCGSNTVAECRMPQYSYFFGCGTNHEALLSIPHGVAYDRNL